MTSKTPSLESIPSDVDVITACYALGFMYGRESRPKTHKNMCIVRTSEPTSVERFLKSRDWVRIQVRRTLRPEELKRIGVESKESMTVFKIEWDEDLQSHRDFLSQLHNVQASRSRFHAAVECEIFLGEVIELDPLYQLLYRHDIPETTLKRWKNNLSELDSTLDTLGFSACERKLLLMSKN